MQCFNSRYIKGVPFVHKWFVHRSAASSYKSLLSPGGEGERCDGPPPFSGPHKALEARVCREVGGGGVNLKNEVTLLPV